MHPFLLALVLLASAATPAAAADLSLTVDPEDAVALGARHVISGTLAQDGEALADEEVTLEGRPLRGSRGFARLASAVTGERGGFRFPQRFDRNVEIRVSAAGERRTRRIYVFPAAVIADRTVGRNRVRLVQRLRGPVDARILGRTRFYLGRSNAESARLVGSARVRRRRAGRYVAQFTVRIPKRFKGRFSFAACYRASRISGLGDPAEPCPRRRFVFED